MKLGKFFKQGATGLIVLTLFLFPVGTFAEAPETPAPEASTPTSENSQASSQGPTTPPGAEGKTYHYNQATGLWENDHYTWNPTTGETKAKDSSAPTYNAETGTWDTTKWRYDAPSGTYVPQVTKTPATTPTTAAAQSGNGGAAAASSTPQTTAVAASGSNAVATAQAGNNVLAMAQSGNATVSHNTTGGNALSGNAQSMTNVLNILQSSWGAPGDGDITTFTADINGTVVGDLLIDPSSFDGEILPSTGLHPSDLDVNVANSGHLDTTVVATAASGDASVDHNTSAGNATTGTATVLANVINLINSTIGAGKSFVGTININGDFEGDILLPEGLRSLLANNDTPSSSTLTDGSLAATFNDSQSITNNVSLSAESGEASVAGNTSAGNATTGSANTNLTIFNMTGRQVVGNNALLVFVNVLGQWVGMIVDAPVGATAAMLGGGITGNNALALAGDTNASFANSNSITNNITASAASGDATVNHNTSGGDATSGDANASVNVANFMGSQFSLADWFGILFINVLGSWHGSFGIDTAMGDPSQEAPSQQTGNVAGVNDVRVFQFVSNGGTTQIKPASLNSSFKASLASSHVATSDQTAAEQVLGTATAAPNDSGSSNTAAKGSFNFWIVLVTLLVATLLLSSERMLGRKKQSTK